MFVFKILKKLTSFFHVNEEKKEKIDYTYFKKCSAVKEVMKEPSRPVDFSKILERDDSGHKVTFDEHERIESTLFFCYNSYYKFSVFPRLISADEERTFTNVVNLFTVDRFIRSKIGYFTGIIESLIKTSLATELSNCYESEEYSKAECYLDFSIFINERVAKETLTSFAETVSRSKEQYIKYHHKHRNGCIPIWVLFEELTFGQIDSFIQQLKPEYRNVWIDETFTKEYRKFMPSWISVARYLRNVSAHHARVYGKNFVVSPKLKKEDMKEYNIRNSEKNNLFVMLFTMKCLVSFLPVDVGKEWDAFIDSLADLIDDETVIFDEKINGFSDNWKKALNIYK